MKAQITVRKIPNKAQIFQTTQNTNGFVFLDTMFCDLVWHFGYLGFVF